MSLVESNIKTEVDKNKYTCLVTHNYLKSNSNSEWKIIMKLVIDNLNEYELNQTEEILNKIKLLLYTITEQIMVDETFYNNGEYSKISDCALHAPRNNCFINKKYKQYNICSTNICSNHMYLETGRVNDEIHGKILWGQVISKLSKVYINEKTKLVEAEYIRKLKKNWCDLKKRKITKSVGKPTAMYVEVPPYEELEPFFNHLKQNNNIENESKEYNRGTIFKDGRMDLCKQVVGPNWIGNLMESLKDNTNISHFLLGNNVTDIEGGIAIKNFLLNEHKPKIKTWYLAGSDFNSEAIKNICDGLMNDTDVESLWLKRNPIYSEGMKYIGNLLTNNKTMKILDLHNTGIGLSEKAYNEENNYEKYLTTDGIMYLFDGLKQNETLDHLYIDANGLTMKSAEIISDYFNYKNENNVKGITSLWIDMNELENRGIAKIVNSLKDYKYIKRLNVGSNMINHIGMKFICDAFKHHKTIQVLDLSLYKSTNDMGVLPNNIGDEGVKFICELIRENKSIRYLNISMNNISNMEQIKEALKENTNIWYFYYSQYGIKISDETQNEIENILLRNREIYKTTYDNNIIFDNKHRRYLKYSKKIDNIDSIYRNNMK